MLQIAGLMSHSFEIKNSSNTVGFIQIAATFCVFVFASLPVFFRFKLAHSTKVDTAKNIRDILYYCSYIIAGLLGFSAVAAIVLLSSFNGTDIAAAIVVVSIFRIIWSALLIYLYLKTKKAAGSCYI